MFFLIEVKTSAIVFVSIHKNAVADANGMEVVVLLEPLIGTERKVSNSVFSLRGNEWQVPHPIEHTRNGEVSGSSWQAHTMPVQASCLAAVPNFWSMLIISHIRQILPTALEPCISWPNSDNSNFFSHANIGIVLHLKSLARTMLLGAGFVLEAESVCLVFSNRLKFSTMADQDLRTSRWYFQASKQAGGIILERCSEGGANIMEHWDLGTIGGILFWRMKNGTYDKGCREILRYAWSGIVEF
jgi:hypothetical protein